MVNPRKIYGHILDQLVFFFHFLGGNYKLEAPPHSYIDVNDFESVESLAIYLKLLQKDKEKYQEYFSWKREYLLYQKDPWCTLCEKLHNQNEQWNTYANVSEWYYNDENGNYLCTDGSERKYTKSSQS